MLKDFKSQQDHTLNGLKEERGILKPVTYFQIIASP